MPCSMGWPGGLLRAPRGRTVRGCALRSVPRARHCNGRLPPGRTSLQPLGRMRLRRTRQRASTCQQQTIGAGGAWLQVARQCWRWCWARGSGRCHRKSTVQTECAARHRQPVRCGAPSNPCRRPMSWPVGCNAQGPRSPKCRSIPAHLFTSKAGQRQRAQ